MTEPESKTRTQITELIAVGVADPATLVLLRTVQEILFKLDALETMVRRFEAAHDFREGNILEAIDRIFNMLCRRRR